MGHLCSSPVALVLTLGALTLDLMEAGNGFAIDTVDIQFPNPNEDISPIPERDGQWDDTRFFGARAVTIAGTIIPAAYGSRSKVLDRLAPFLAQTARPTLTYQIDADAPARFVTLRATNLTAPATNPTISAFQLAWKAADPAAYGVALNQVVIAPTAAIFGRTYTHPQGAAITNTSGWQPPRVYPHTSGAVNVVATNQGTLSTPPLIVVKGGCTNPKVWNDTAGAVFAVGTTAQPLVLAAGSSLTIDARNRLVYLGNDPTNTRYNYVDFSVSSWWSLLPGDNHLRFVPDTADGAANATVSWNDAYL
jgi:hypothetical protein